MKPTLMPLILLPLALAAPTPIDPPHIPYTVKNMLKWMYNDFKRSFHEIHSNIRDGISDILFPKPDPNFITQEEAMRLMHEAIEDEPALYLQTQRDSWEELFKTNFYYDKLDEYKAARGGSISDGNLGPEFDKWLANAAEEADVKWHEYLKDPENEPEWRRLSKLAPGEKEFKIPFYYQVWEKYSKAQGSPFMDDEAIGMWREEAGELADLAWRQHLEEDEEKLKEEENQKQRIEEDKRQAERIEEERSKQKIKEKKEWRQKELERRRAAPEEWLQRRRNDREGQNKQVNDAGVKQVEQEQERRVNELERASGVGSEIDKMLEVGFKPGDAKVVDGIPSINHRADLGEHKIKSDESESIDNILKDVEDVV